MSKKALDALRRPGRDPRTIHDLVVGPGLPPPRAPRPAKPRPRKADPVATSKRVCVRSLERLVDEAQAEFNESGERLRRCQEALDIMRDGLPKEPAEIAAAEGKA